MNDCDKDDADDDAAAAAVAAGWWLQIVDALSRGKCLILSRELEGELSIHVHAPDNMSGRQMNRTASRA
jgi:hypothetical protein